MNNAKKILLFLSFFVFLILKSSFLNPILAQTLGLSISPPINEIMIIPGKEITQTLTITNDGNDGMASINIIPFHAQGENGDVLLDEKGAVTSDPQFSSWFKIISPGVTFGEKFYIPGGGKQDVIIKISPPSAIPEKDYYFTVIYQLDNEIPGIIAPIGPINQARIGSNLMISVSKDGKPEKTLNIVEFSAPKFIDSLGKLIFKIRIGNFASYVFKPTGQITVKPIIGNAETLNIAPLNVIADSVRNIPCINGEETIVCESKHKVFIGIYKSTLTVSPDDGGAKQEKTTTTIAFPFSIIFGAIIIILLLRKIIPHKESMLNQ